MAWTVEKEKLLEVMEVLDLVPNRSGISASVFVRLEGNGSKLRISLSSEVCGSVAVRGIGTWPVGKVIFLDRRLLFPFIRVAQHVSTKSNFEFKYENKELHIKHGKRNAHFAVVDNLTGYEVLRKKKSGIRMVLDTQLRKLMASARGCAVSDPSVPHLNCIYMKPKGKFIEVYTTNGAVGFHATMRVKKALKVKVPFPLYLTGLLTEKGIKAIQYQKNLVALDFNCGDLWQMVSVKAKEKFPLKTIVRMLDELRGTKVLLKMECSKLHAVTERLQLYLASVSRTDWVLWLRGKKGDKEILLEVMVPQGIFREKVRLVTELGKDLDLEWPLETMLPVFSYLGDLKDGSKLEVRGGGGENTPYFLTSGTLQVAVSRIVREEKKKKKKGKK